MEWLILSFASSVIQYVCLLHSAKLKQVFFFCDGLSSSWIGASQLVLASEADVAVDSEGQPSSVLVHRLGGLATPNEVGGGSGAAAQPARELVLDQRRYANISRYVRITRRAREGGGGLRMSHYHAWP